MSVLIGADVVPSGANKEIFISGNLNDLVGAQLEGIIKAADYRIYNVETPLTDVETPIKKCGPNLIAPTATIQGYINLKADLVTLANNHILDQGEQGLLSTIKCFSDANIAHVGIGKGTNESFYPYYFDYNERKIGVYACAEHEFSIADNGKYGANPFDPLESLDQIFAASKHCDYLIVLYHGGKEYHRYPSPQLKHICHRIVEKGANLVICQHSHCIGCEEDYEEGKIIYGQGNFIFDGVNNEYWQTSFLVEIDENLKVSYIPLKKNGACVRLANEEEAEHIMKAFEERSTKVTDDEFIIEEYKKRASEMLEMYFSFFLCVNRNLIYRGLNKLSRHRFGRWFVNKMIEDRKLTLTNFIECEAHRELLLSGLKDE